MRQRGQRALIGVIGPTMATPEERERAENLGELLARKGWSVLSGGRSAGVMGAVNHGARSQGGLTIGLLPDESGDVSPDVDVVIRTGLGSARNNIIALSSDVLVACGSGAGTSSEISLGIKAGRPVILLGPSDLVWDYFRELGGQLVSRAATPDEAIDRIEQLLS